MQNRVVSKSYQNHGRVFVSADRSWKAGVLIRLDQHFIERGPYRSKRERTLEIMDWGRIVFGLISPTWLESINNSPPSCTQDVERAQADQGWTRRQHSTHSTLRARGGRSVCEARRRSVPSRRYWKSSPTTRTKSYSAKVGRSQQVVDSAELKQ